MFWKNKIQNPKKGNFTKLEIEILKSVMAHLPEEFSITLQQQIKYLILFKRIEYKNDVITELYPEKYGSIPNKILFLRTEEFRLANVKFLLSNTQYIAEINMVLGQIFDIKIAPKPIKDIDDNPEILKVIIEDNLKQNTY